MIARNGDKLKVGHTVRVDTILTDGIRIDYPALLLSQRPFLLAKLHPPYNRIIGIHESEIAHRIWTEKD